MSINKIVYENIDNAIIALKKLKAEDVIVNHFKPASSGSNYYSVAFKIEGKLSTFTVKFSRENFKITPQTNGENGPSKVRCTFFIDDSKLGQLYEIIEPLVITAIRNKLPEKTYPNLKGIIQAHTSFKNKEGIDEDKPIDKKLGWVTLPCLTKPYTKTIYGGSISLVLAEKQSKKLATPTYDEITEYWKNRAVVTGFITIDNILVMKSKQIYFTIGINTFKPLSVLPIQSQEIDNTEDIDDLVNFASEKGYVRENTVHKDEDLDDFGDQPC